MMKFCVHIIVKLNNSNFKLSDFNNQKGKKIKKMKNCFK